MGVRLSAEYQEVEYIEANGTQIIDTDYLPVGGDEMLIELSFSSYPPRGTYYCFAATDNSDPQVQLVFGTETIGTTLFYKYFSTGDARKLRINFAVDTIYRIDVAANGDCTCNGVTASPLNNLGYATGHLRFFARMAGNINFYGRLYKFVASHDGIEKVNLVPCYRKADDEAGLYDLVTGEFFTNAGTGEFLVGPDVIDSISPLMVAWRRIMMAAASVAKKLLKIRIENGFTLGGNAKTETDRLLNEKGYDIQLKWLILTQSETFETNKLLTVFNNAFFHRKASDASIVNNNYVYGSNSYACVGSAGDVYTIFDYNQLNPLISKTVIADTNMIRADEIVNFIFANAPDNTNWYLVCKDISTGNINAHDFAFVYVNSSSSSAFSRFSNSSGAVDRTSPTAAYEVFLNTGEKLFYIPIPVSAN